MTDPGSTDVCATCGETWEWHKAHQPRHVFAVRLDDSTLLVGSHPEASVTPSVNMTVDHLETAFEEITLLYDDLNLHPDDHSVASVRFRVSRVREHLMHARDQRFVERTSR